MCQQTDGPADPPTDRQTDSFLADYLPPFRILVVDILSSFSRLPFLTCAPAVHQSNEARWRREPRYLSPFLDLFAAIS